MGALMGQHKESGFGRQMGGEIDSGPHHPQQEGCGQAGVFPGSVGGAYCVKQPPAQEQIGDQGVARHGQHPRQPHPGDQRLPGEGGGGLVGGLDGLAGVLDRRAGVDRLGDGAAGRSIRDALRGNRGVFPCPSWLALGGGVIQSHRLGGRDVRQRLWDGGEGAFQADG